jgi:hypothetical protein
MVANLLAWRQMAAKLKASIKWRNGIVDLSWGGGKWRKLA